MRIFAAAEMSSRLGFAGPSRLAVALQPPAGHQRDMAQGHVAQVALWEAFRVHAVGADDLHPASGDDDAVEDKAAALLAGDRERIRPLGHVVEHANHRPLAIGSADLQALPRFQFDGDRLAVHGAVLDLHHSRTQALLVLQPFVFHCRIGGLRSEVLLVLVPLRDGGIDGVEGAGCRIVLGHFVEPIAQRLEQGPAVLAAAHARAERVVVGDPHTALGQLPGRENDATAHRIHRHLPPLGAVAPVGKVGGNHFLTQNGLRCAFGWPVRGVSPTSRIRGVGIA